MKNKVFFLYAFLLLLLFTACAESEQTNSSASKFNKIVPGHIIVKYRNTATSTSITKSGISFNRKTISVSKHKNFSSVYASKRSNTLFSELYRETSTSALIELDTSDVDETIEAIESLRKNPNVEYAEPDYYLSLAETPNDPEFASQQWGSRQISLEQAWSVSTGSPSVVVAVLDGGIDYTHPDLASNCIAGYDFVNTDSDPFDDDGHGTHVAGIIGAVGNNGVGIAGTAWNVSLLPVKISNSSGNLTTSAAIMGIDFAISQKAFILNCSWYDKDGYSQALYDALERSRKAGILVVIAAGNGGSNRDANPEYPVWYDCDNIITVAATDQNDELASISDYGIRTVDVAAPGVDIYSTLPGNSYGYKSGTSMAAPYVAGIAALLKSYYPSMTYSQIKKMIIASSIFKPALIGKLQSGGVVNAKAAFDLVTFQKNMPDFSFPFRLSDTYGKREPYFVDVNRDGFKEVLYKRTYTYYSGQITDQAVYQSSSSGWIPLNNTYCPPVALWHNGVSNGYLLVDFDKDGYDDFTSTTAAYRNTGSGWVAAASGYRLPKPIIDGYGETSLRCIDLNHDGYKDLMYSRIYNRTLAPGYVVQVEDKGCYLNTGTGWVKMGDEFNSPCFFTRFGVDACVKFIDADKDGYEDILCWDSANNINVAYRNTGTGWTLMRDWYLLPETSFDQYGDTGMRSVDFDHDGFKDLITFRQRTILIAPGYYQTEYTKSQHKVWSGATLAWYDTSENFCSPIPLVAGGGDNGVYFIDADHDGFEDLLYDNSDGKGFYLNYPGGWFR